MTVLINRIPNLPLRIHVPHRIRGAEKVWRVPVVLLREGILRNPSSEGGVIDAGAEVAVGDAEGDALQRVGVVGPPGVDEGTHIVLPGAGGGVCGRLRPVGEVCVVGFHGGSGLDLRRQVKQIVRRLQGIGGMSKPYSQKQKNKDKALPVKGSTLSFSVLNSGG